MPEDQRRSISLIVIIHVDRRRSSYKFRNCKIQNDIKTRAPEITLKNTDVLSYSIMTTRFFPTYCWFDSLNHPQTSYKTLASWLSQAQRVQGQLHDTQSIVWQGNRTRKIAHRAVFIDYKAAFDTVSHKFVDEALGNAGVSTKVRTMFRAVYKAAVAFTTVAGTDGKQIRSETFDISRGVVQGDVMSRLFFIMALELILRR